MRLGLRLYLPPCHVPFLPFVYSFGGPAALVFAIGMIAVATVLEVRAGTVLVGFDGWSSKWNYYVDARSTNLRPVGYCERFGLDLEPPKGTVSRPGRTLELIMGPCVCVCVCVGGCVA